MSNNTVVAVVRGGMVMEVHGIDEANKVLVVDYDSDGGAVIEGEEADIYEAVAVSHSGFVDEVVQAHTETEE